MGVEPPQSSAGGSAARPSPSQPVALDLRDHVLFDTDEPRAQPIAAGGGLSLQLFCLEPRQSLPATTLDVDRLYTVIGGRAWTVVDDAEIHLDPLQAVLVPAGAAHGLRNDSADPLILQVVDGRPGGHTSPVVQAAEAATGAPIRHDERPGPTTSGPTTSGPTTSGPTTSERSRFARVRRLLGSGD